MSQHVYRSKGRQVGGLLARELHRSRAYLITAAGGHHRCAICP